MNKNFKILLVTNGITQKELASKIGISQQAVNKFCNRGSPRLETIIKIAKALNSDINEIINCFDQIQ